MRRKKPYTPNDKFFYKAKELGYRARSAFKLIEIQECFQLMQLDDIVLDIGAYPGSFMQVARDIVGKNGLVVGIDRKPIKKFTQKHLKTFVADVFDSQMMEEVFTRLGCTRVDVIISDLAPNTSGMRDIDQRKSVDLDLEVLRFSHRWLKPGGHLLLKVLHGEDFPELIAAVKTNFQSVKTFKPKATRDRSVEIYIVAKGKLSQDEMSL